MVRACIKTNNQFGANVVLGMFLKIITIIIVNNKNIQLNENDAHKISNGFDLVISSFPNHFLCSSKGCDNSSIVSLSIVSTIEKPVIANPNTHEPKVKMSPHSSFFCISQ